jgi:hypothetical protein
VKFWLLTPTWNQVLRLAFEDYLVRKKEKRNNNNKNCSKPQQKSP